MEEDEGDGADGADEVDGRGEQVRTRLPAAFGTVGDLSVGERSWA